MLPKNNLVVYSTKACPSIMPYLTHRFLFYGCLVQVVEYYFNYINYFFKKIPCERDHYKNYRRVTDDYRRVSDDYKQIRLVIDNYR